MALDLSVVIGNGITAAKRAGVAATATLTRPAPAPNPTTGVVTGSAVPQTVDVVQTDARRSVASGDAAWAQARVVLLCGARGLLFEPKRGDACTFAGVTGTVTAVEVMAPAGTPVAYTFAVGA